MIIVDLRVTVRTDDVHSESTRDGHHERERGGTGMVDPMEIVENQHDRIGGRDAFEEMSEGAQNLEPSRSRIDRSIGADCREHFADVWQDVHQRRSDRAQQPNSLVGLDFPEIPLERFHERRIRRSPLTVRTSSPQHHMTLADERISHLADQPGLADARLTHDHRN